MFKEVVHVVTVEDEKVRVKFEKKAACAGCKSVHLCGNKGEQTMTINNPQGIPLRQNDKIEVGIPEKKNLFAALIAFFLPAVLFLAALILGKSRGEVFSFSIAFLTVLVYYLIMRNILKHRGSYFNLTILRKL